ncbi:hypothetical protein FPOA_12888 [Fusarium poae]|uniref:HTH CENPB-type domain-containing protein n=2 Tax=Fusarium poae TaxID=36050 RepID=A0A1B8A7N4_FUSPO|nr:hypothetical protein FPOA_12888 [Fusarium poae]
MLRSRLRWKYTEDDVAEAILDVTDNGFSPLQAAHRRGVPRRTLIDRLHGRGAVKEQIHPHRRLSKRQEDRLAFWILRQESLGYAPSHSQIRACVMGLLRQQGEHPNLGRNWVIKFINRRADLKTKMGRRQEAKRFDSFTPKAVHWYFDIRDGQYGWIKPENTVNADEGGIMTGFGLDSLVVGSADPKRKAFLKGPQTRNWTSFIEAVTADGRALVPGIISKGKELQKQWFLEEFKQIADWYYITSPNGWTDDHIGIEWLERVYLPQTTPADESDARLIILDGHGSHATDEWMATCFLNNVYCCYLPAHCSHGLQPLDNEVFNALKAAYRRELERFASLTDSAPMDKVNFIRAYAKARRVGMTKKNILSGWRVTGNWPISRAKALRHPEIQQDRPNGSPRVTPEPRPYLGSDDTPQTSRQIRDLGLNKTPKTRRRYNVIAKGFEAHQQTVAAHTQRIASLEEELARLKRGKKRKAVPNPNKRFMTLGETLAVVEKMSSTSYTVSDVVDAMLDVSDNGLSQYQAAQMHGIPPATLSDRLRGLPSKPDIIQPAQLLSKSQETRLVTWILRQEALGYAPSHSQVRATVAALLRQQGQGRTIGVHWISRFMKRHPDIETKIGRRQEASRFNSFTPKAVSWYFDIREQEYGWIKPENTANVDEGGIMAGFGLDSLVIGSSDPKRKAFLKGSQSRT